MKKIFLAFLIFIIPSSVLAHGKWLVDKYQEVIASQHGTFNWYSWNSKEVIIWSLLTIFTVMVASYLHKIIPEWKKLASFARENRGIIDKTAQAVLGIFLVATALFWNVVIVPSEVVNTPLQTTLQWIQIIIGLMLIMHTYTRFAALALLALSLVITISSGFETVLENIVLFSLAIYFYLVHSPVSGVLSTLKKYSIDIVRIGTGISLIALAFTEKLLYPELGMQFLVEHDWNFMISVFPWFSNELFVLSTGFAEMLFGIVFIFGYITRINTVVISIFFVMSVSVMLVQANVWEVEDFVVYCSAILLVFFSHGHTTLPELIKKIQTKNL